MEMVAGEVLQAVLLGALPVALLLLTLALCQVAVLWNNARRRVEQARIVPSCRHDGAIFEGTARPVETSPQAQSEARLTAGQDEDGNNKLVDEDSLNSGGVEGRGHGIETLLDASAGDKHRAVPRRGATSSLRFCLRWILLFVLCCSFALALVLLFGFLAFMSFNESVTKAARRTTHCKIVSKGVDLRFSRICELNRNGHLSTDSKLWCYLDYYWASVFKVEYRPHLSALPMLAAVEAPREALPAECRPDFGVVWRLNEGYQINATYPCKYNPKNLMMVDIAEQMADNCESQEPHLYELVRRFLTLVFFSEDTARAVRATGRTFFSGALGFFTPMLMLLLVRLIRYTYWRWQTPCRQT